MAQTLVCPNTKKKIAFFLGLGFWLFFFLLPFFSLLKKFLFFNFYETYSVVLSIVKDSWYQSIFVFTFQQAFLSAFFTLLVGIPTSFVFAKFNLRFFKKIYFVFLLPFIMPTILVVLSIIQFWGHQGIVNSFLKTIFHLQDTPLRLLYSLKGILIAHIFFNLPVVLQIVGNAKQKITSKYSEATLILGASVYKAFWKIELPLLLPAISAAFILIFLLCMNSFAVVWILGGGKNLILETLIYEFAKIHLDYQSVLIFALFQILLGIVFVKIFYHLQVNYVIQEPVRKKSFYYFLQKHPIQGGLIMVWLAIVLLFIVGPLFALVLDSFRTPQGLSLYWWSLLLEGQKNTFLTIFFTSLQIAFASATLSFILLLLIFPFFLQWTKYRKNLEVVFLTPLSTSLIALGLGWFLFYQEFLQDINFPLIFYIICIHSVIFFAYWLKIFLPSLESIPKNWLMIKVLYGYSWLSFSRSVLYPWLRKPFLQNFSLVMALSFGELSILLMVSDHSFSTLTTYIFAAMSSYQFSFASVIGVIFLSYFFLQNLLLELLLKKNTSVK